MQIPLLTVSGVHVSGAKIALFDSHPGVALFQCLTFQKREIPGGLCPVSSVTFG